MNMKKIAALLSLPLMLLSLSANAGFINTDWLVTGDAKATLHEETGLEWLKLNNTAGQSLNAVSANSAFDGWRFADAAEVENLISSIFPLLSFNEGETRYDSSSYISDATRWGTFMGLTGGGTVKRSLGFYIQNDGLFTTGSEYRSTTGRLFDDVGPYANGDAAYSFSNSVFGVFLVSDGGTTLSSQNDPSLNQNNPNFGVASVSEPAGLAILSAGLLGLVFARRRKDGSAIKN